MSSLKEIRTRIQSVTSTQQITKAMKMVSAAKLKRATDRIVNLRPYAQKLKTLVLDVCQSSQDYVSPLISDRKIEKLLIIIITSNRGLAGAFNASVFRHIEKAIKQHYQYLKPEQINFCCIGKKGQDYCLRANKMVIASHNDIYQDLDYQQVLAIAQQMIDFFEKKVYDRIEIFYNEFKNPVVQINKRETLLPFVPKPENKDGQKKSNHYIYEPNEKALLSTLIPKAIGLQLYKSILDSNASEHGARMTAMDTATENAEEIYQQLKLSYNQARQSAITKEILEIISGANALES